MKVRLHPSASGRWMACTPSALAESRVPHKSSTFSEEGDLAHELAEIEILLYLGLIDQKSFNKEFRRIKKSEYYSQIFHRDVNKYLDLIKELHSNTSEQSITSVEGRYALDQYLPNSSGVVDFSILDIDSETLYIRDLKFGRGVRVDAPNNPQLRLYALGAYMSLSDIYDIGTVSLGIIQPRLNNYSEEVLSIEDLLEWAEFEVKPKAAKALKGEGVRIAGKHCKFCKVAAVCRTLKDYALQDIEQYNYQNPDTLSDSEILAIYDHIEVINSWTSSVSEYMLGEALRGKNWQGLKLVEGGSKRKWKDEIELKKRLRSAGFKLAEYTERKILGVPKITSLLESTSNPEGARDAVLGDGDMIEKPKGKPTLAPLTDKRPLYNSLEDDFKQLLS